MTTSAVNGNHHKVRVLLADDSLVFLKTLQHFLQKCHELKIVGVAHNGREALALAKAERPDIILLDLLMPELSGLEIIPDLRASLPNSRVIVLSLLGYREIAAIVGADEFVFKPELATELVPAIQRVLQNHLACTDSHSKLNISQ